MKYSLAILCALSLLAPVAPGQLSGDGITSSEFPGLRLLPPGSKIKGISLPRYENHRVSALLTGDIMEILTRSDVAFTGIKAQLYAENAETTTVICPDARYSFRTKIVESPTPTRLEHPRFTAQGTGVIFSTKNNQGILKGPVKTTIESSVFNKNTKAK
ncbi:MAG: LPS export ABC transporter periplasmic protein LptC [Akkermansia sp.]|nr:LPS export ABC transporter periplasmic protein LptC [Akkermansia sp.]